MLKQRVLTAIVLVALVVVAAWAGLLAFSALAAIVFGAAFFEWVRLAGFSQRFAVVSGIAFGAVLFAISASGWHLSDTAAIALCASAAALSGLIAGLLALYESGRTWRLPASVSVLMAVLILSAAWYGVLRFYTEDGGIKLVSVLALVWTADVAAYFAGRAFGRHKLAVHISPGKTWEGVLGAVLVVLLLALVLQQTWRNDSVFSTSVLNGAGWLGFVALTVIVLVSVAGDLFESLLKRQAGVKDSSGLLPGHGGMLDRIDAAIAAVPLAWLIDKAVG